jgi:hypothetical protein
MAAQSKRSEKSPDYWGEIAIDVKDMTKVQKTEDGYLVFKINGWKRKTKAGVTYLSLAVDRYIPKEEGRPSQKDEDDEDVPF